MDRHLFWTGDNGLAWNDITPPLPPTATIYAVKFIDSEKGWVLWAENDSNGNLELRVSHTSDTGVNWSETLVQTITPDDPAFYIENGSMEWLDVK